MHDPSMAFPAFSLLIDMHHRLFMTPNAIFLNDFFSVSSQLDTVGDCAGIKDGDILHSVNGFPDIMNPWIIIRQMAVNAHLSPVRAGSAPCIKLGLHDVALNAECGLVRFGQEFGRAECKKQNKNKSACCDEQGYQLLRFARAHT
jgi:hypothetical protein